MADVPDTQAEQQELRGRTVLKRRTTKRLLADARGQRIVALRSHAKVITMALSDAKPRPLIVQALKQIAAASQADPDIVLGFAIPQGAGGRGPSNRAAGTPATGGAE